MSQTNFSMASDRHSGHQPAPDSPPSLPGHIDLRGGATDDDAALIALGQQFEEIAAKVQTLCNSAERDSHLDQIEGTLARLEPIEREIMTMPARTAAGLGVKARHAAHVMREYWNEPIDRIDWDARAVRLLIEAVCQVARVALPFRDFSITTNSIGEAPPETWPSSREEQK